MPIVPMLVSLLLLALPPAEAPLERVALGSCARETVPQPVWDVVAARRPGVLLLLGDAVYAGSYDPAVLGRALATLREKPEYRRLRETVPVLAVWDDNDYGRSDSGAEHPRKVEAQQVFLDAFDEPASSPRRQHEGIYGAWSFGPPGKRTQIVLLDTRYFRSPLSTQRVLGRSAYVPSLDPAATMLGEAQWAWLEQTLDEPADLRLIASSIQVLPDNHPGEKWANFPGERERLLDLLATTTGGVVLVSGDQHLGELSRLHRDGLPDLLELTASGLTHTRHLMAPNRHRHPDHGIVLDHHFGEVDIDWSEPDPLVTLRIITVAGDVALEHAFRLSQITRR